MSGFVRILYARKLDKCGMIRISTQKIFVSYRVNTGGKDVEPCKIKRPRGCLKEETPNAGTMDGPVYGKNQRF